LVSRIERTVMVASGIRSRHAFARSFILFSGNSPASRWFVRIEHARHVLHAKRKSIRLKTPR
jgi:hypothetical protein